MQVCPSCKRNQKNLILHIEKSNKCKDNVSEEDIERSIRNAKKTIYEETYEGKKKKSKRKHK